MIPAFPPNENSWGDKLHGMELRDYFAAKAMQSMCEGQWPSPDDCAEIAKRSYGMASAMLKERQE